MSAFLISFLARSILLGAAGYLALKLIRGSKAAFTHFLAMTFLLAIVVLPWMSLALPEQKITVESVPAAVELIRSPKPVIEPAVVVGPVHEATPQVPALLYVWGAVAAFLLLRLVLGIALFGLRVRRSAPVEGLGRYAVRQDDYASVPVTGWLGRHYILLPREWRFWTAERIERVLSHEEAHIRRNDWLWQLMAGTACALFWLNPFVWLLAREVRRHAEHAADDLVLAKGGDASGYAQDLLDLTRNLQATGSPVMIPMARRAEVARRIEMILKSNRRRGAASIGSLAMGLLFTATLAATLSTVALVPSGDLPYLQGVALLGKMQDVSLLGRVIDEKSNDTMYEMSVRIYKLPSKRPGVVFEAQHAVIDYGDKKPGSPRAVGIHRSDVANVAKGLEKQGAQLHYSPTITTDTGGPATVKILNADGSETFFEVGVRNGGWIQYGLSLKESGAVKPWGFKGDANVRSDYALAVLQQDPAKKNTYVLLIDRAKA